MNIIFGTSEAEKLDDKYIVLELDTITIRNSAPITVYCVVENLPLVKLTEAEPYKNLHANLMENYKNRDWNFCEQALEKLLHFWGADMDTFYDSLQKRVLEYKDTEPAEDWTHIVPR
jgi:hypothetical protein